MIRFTTTGLTSLLPLVLDDHTSNSRPRYMYYITDLSRLVFTEVIYY